MLCNHRIPIPFCNSPLYHRVLFDPCPWQPFRKYGPQERLHENRCRFSTMEIPKMPNIKPKDNGKFWLGFNKCRTCHIYLHIFYLFFKKLTFSLVTFRLISLCNGNEKTQHIEYMRTTVLRYPFMFIFLIFLFENSHFVQNLSEKYQTPRFTVEFPSRVLRYNILFNN